MQQSFGLGTMGFHYTVKHRPEPRGPALYRDRRPLPYSTLRESTEKAALREQGSEARAQGTSSHLRLGTITPCPWDPCPQKGPGRQPSWFRTNPALRGRCTCGLNRQQPEDYRLTVSGPRSAPGFFTAAGPLSPAPRGFVQSGPNPLCNHFRSSPGSCAVEPNSKLRKTRRHGRQAGPVAVSLATSATRDQSSCLSVPCAPSAPTSLITPATWPPSIAATPSTRSGE